MKRQCSSHDRGDCNSIRSNDISLCEK